MYFVNTNTKLTVPSTSQAQNKKMLPTPPSKLWELAGRLAHMPEVLPTAPHVPFFKFWWDWSEFPKNALLCIQYLTSPQSLPIQDKAHPHLARLKNKDKFHESASLWQHFWVYHLPNEEVIAVTESSQRNTSLTPPAPWTAFNVELLAKLSTSFMHQSFSSSACHQQLSHEHQRNHFSENQQKSRNSTFQ